MTRALDAILFDAFGTLFSPVSAGSPPAHLRRLLASDGVRVSLASAEQALLAEIALFRAKFPLVRDEQELRQLEDEASDLVIAELALGQFPRHRMRQHLLDLFTPTAYPDAEPSLGRLRQEGLALGVVSNYNSLLAAHLTDLGLVSWFSVIVNSADFGRPKPDSGIFNEAVRQLGVSHQNVLYVGDDLENDYYGARQAGLHAVLLNRDYTPIPEGVLSISTLADLPRILNQPFP